MSVSQEVGYKIRHIRKKRGMTTEELAAAICKSKSAISKYENGSVVLDIQTLYEIAGALGVRVDQLLYVEPEVPDKNTSEEVPAFFKDLGRLYMYYYDGRNNQILRCVVDIGSKNENDNSYSVMTYMNFDDYAHYQVCENTYSGKLRHYGSLSSLDLQNWDMPMDHYQIAIPAPYMNTMCKWGLAYGISSRPLMPTSVRMLISKTIQKENREFLQSLKISKEDIRLLKLYNMLVVL